jgi:hypothetical protein
MNQQENKVCPYCGVPISPTDKYCKNCGKTLIEQTSISEPPLKLQSIPAPPPEQPYERKYSILQRFYKLLVSPHEAMQDIGLTPEYTGPIVILILRTILTILVIAGAYSKMQWAGDPGTIRQVTGILSGIITLAIIIGVGLTLAFWLGKALIVKYTCDSGSNWAFTTAASVTGYAYLPELILGIISFAVIYPMIPTITLNVSDIDAARRALTDFQATLLWIRIVFSLPISIISLLWKSYLGGLGTKFGTREKASLALGFVVFFVLGLIGWLISFALTGNL